MSTTKPPLGIIPMGEHDHTRRVLLLEAMLRYEAVFKTIPEEWVQEYTELRAKLRGMIND